MPNARFLQDSQYVNGSPLPATWWQELDTAQEQAIDGSAGGTWAPSAQLVIAGAGMWFCGPTTHATASGVETTNGSGKRVTHGDNDWIGMYSVPDRASITACAQGRDASYGLGSSTPRMAFEVSASGLINPSSNTNYAGGARFVLPLDVHHGAEALVVVLSFTVSVHSGVPTNLPAMRVVQVDGAGNVTLLNQTVVAASSNYVGNGFLTVASRPGSGSAWHDGGAVQSITYPMGDTVIDTTQYCYFVEVLDESGSNCVSGNEYLSALATFAVSDMRPQ